MNTLPDVFQAPPPPRIPVPVVVLVQDRLWLPVRSQSRNWLPVLFLICAIVWAIRAAWSSPAPIPAGPPSFTSARLSEGDSVQTGELTMCVAIEEGLDRYDTWLKTRDVNGLHDIMRQYGGELIGTWQRLRVVETGPRASLVRIPGSSHLCYMPSRLLRHYSLNRSSH
jgi:hypothetical protein